MSELSSEILSRLPTIISISCHDSCKNVAVNFHKYTECNKERDPIVLEMSLEIIPNRSITPFERVQFT